MKSYSLLGRNCDAMCIFQRLQGISTARVRVSEGLAVIIGNQESRKTVFVVWKLRES